MTEKLERPCSSSAQTSPSSTQSGVRTARSSARATVAKRSVRSLPRRLVSVASPPATDADRPVAVPLDLVEPLVAGRHVVGERRQHRLVLAPRARAPEAPSSCLRRSSQFFSSPSSFAGTSVQRPSRRSPCEADGQAAVGLLLDELVGAAVPDLDRAGAVLARGDLALERRVVERVVLDVHGEVALPGLERDALGDGPARERAVALEAEVVVEPARVVALHDEDRARPAGRARRTARGSCPCSACARTPAVAPRRKHARDRLAARRRCREAAVTRRGG